MATVRKPWQFQPGQPGGPGRPVGARNKLTEAALAALGADFSVHGSAVIRQVREEHPHRYLAIVASLLPRQVEKLESPFAELTDDEIEQLETLLAGLRARTVKALDRHEQQPESSPPLPGDLLTSK